DGTGVLWNCWNRRSDRIVDHTLRLAVRALGTCRILGYGFCMRRSVSGYLERAQCAVRPARCCVTHAVPDAFCVRGLRGGYCLAYYFRCATANDISSCRWDERHGRRGAEVAVSCGGCASAAVGC